MVEEKDASDGRDDAEAAAQTLDAMARRYLTLWQEQVTALSANPAISEAMADLLASWPLGPAGESRQGTGGEGKHAAGASDIQSPDLAASDRPSPVAGGDRYHELSQRIDSLEERLARLEGR